MNYFGLPLPQRPPKIIKTGENPTALNDEMMFKNIFTGMQYMVGWSVAIINEAIYGFKNLFLPIYRKLINIAF